MSKVVDAVVDTGGDIFGLGRSIFNKTIGALWDSLTPDVPEEDFATLAKGLQKGIDQPRRITFGRDRVGGVIAHQAEVERGGKKFVQMVVLINGAAIDALEDVYIASKPITDYPSESWDYELSDGRHTTANAKALAKMAGWTAQHVGYGQAHIFIELENNREVFADGISETEFLIRGARVWDPRDTTQNPDDETTWAWSQNAVLCALHYVRFYGAHEVPFDRLPLPWWIAAINVCDEDAEFTDSNGVVTTEKRYTTNGSFTFSSKPLEVLNQLESCFAGKIFRQMGQWYVRVGAWYGNPTYTINKDDVHGNIKIKWHADLRDRANIVRATFTDPEQNYDRTDAPPVVSQQYQLIDNQILEKSITLPFVRSSTTAQRLATIHLEQTRLGEIELPLKHKGLAAAVGRTVYLNLPNESITNKVYRVVERRFRLDGGVTLMCVEDGPGLWADNIVPGAQDLTPNSDYLVGNPQPVFDVRVSIDVDGNGIIKWNHPSPLAVNEYDIEFVNTAANEQVFKTSVTYTQVTIPNLQLGEYTARISAKNIFGQRSLVVAVQFSVLVPTLPTVFVTADFNQITLTAEIAAAGIGTQFEWEFLGTTAIPQNGERVLAQIYTRIGLKSETEYQFRVRSVNQLGASDWVDVIASTTLVDLTEFINGVELTQLSEAAQALIEDMSTQVDRLRPGTQNNLPDLIASNIGAIDLQRIEQEDMALSVLGAAAGYTNWRTEYERRAFTGEMLIDAAVFFDPSTGKIINRAFAYTDKSFNSTLLLIDGVKSTITLNAQELTRTQKRMTNAEAELIVQAGKISQRTTFSEVESQIAGALEALQPAYSWQFNSGSEGFNPDSHNAEGYIVATNAITSGALNYNATENPIFRLRVRKHANATWKGDIKFNSSATVINLPEPSGADWEVVSVDATGASGYSGTITSLKFDLGPCDIDFIEVGKRGANDLALKDITARTSVLESELNAVTGTIGQYAKTAWVNDQGYQTQSNVNQILDSFNSTYKVSATLQEFSANGTLEKANNAQTFINGADAYIEDRITTYISGGPEGIGAKLSDVTQRLDAAEGVARTSIGQIAGIELDLKDKTFEGIVGEYSKFAIATDLTKVGVKASFADEKLKAQTTELESIAEQSVNLASLFNKNAALISNVTRAVANNEKASVIRDERYKAQFEESKARFSDVTTAIANIDEANVIRDQEMASFVFETASSFDEVAQAFANQEQAYTTLGQTLTAKIGNDTLEAKNAAIATAQQYTRTAVGYCVNAQGQISSQSDAVACVAAGGSWVAGPLAEFIENLQISEGGKTASIKQMRQVFKTVDGKLVARGGWQLDNNGRAVGVVGYNDGQIGNLDLVGDVIRQGAMVGNTFVPTSYVDNTDPAKPLHVIRGRLELGDGHVVTSLDDIKAQDGEPGADGKRGGERETVGTASGVWYDSVAKAAMPDGVAVLNDIVTIYKSGDPSVETTKRFNGSTWQSYTLRVHGSALIEDSLDAKVIRAGSTMTSPKIVGGEIVITEPDSDYLDIVGRSTPFGPAKDLISWYGPKINGVTWDSATQSAIYSGMSKGNAVSYKTNNGGFYFGGTFQAGILSISRQATNTSGALSVLTDPFTIPGGTTAITIAASVSAQGGAIGGGTCPANQYKPNSTIDIERLVGDAWQSIAGNNALGTVNCTQEGPEMILSVSAGVSVNTSLAVSAGQSLQFRAVAGAVSFPYDEAGLQVLGSRSVSIVVTGNN